MSHTRSSSSVFIMSTSSEEKIIRKRLVVEGDSGQDDRRIIGLLKTYIRWCGADLSPEENDATYQKMLFTLSKYLLFYRRTVKPLNNGHIGALFVVL